MRSRGFVSLLFLILGFAVLVFLVVTLTVLKGSPPSFPGEQTSKVSPPIIPSPKPGYTIFVHKALRFGFSYPETAILSGDLQSGAPWEGAIDSYSLRIDSLYSSELYDAENHRMEINNALLTTIQDKCRADGALGYVHCQSNKVENFTNSVGTKGYKIYRSVVVATKPNLSAQYSISRHTDVVYVFTLPKDLPCQQSNSPDCAAIIFYIDPEAPVNKIAQDQSLLDMISNTFFTF